MKTQQKLIIGGALATLGGLAAIFGPGLGVDRPWSFVVGFLVGVVTGLGATLAVVGLLERRVR